jgi:putative sugar O-methyltransferase
VIQCWPEGRIGYIDDDIPLTCLFADYHLAKALPDVGVVPSTDSAIADVLRIADMAPVLVLPNWQMEALEGKIDLFVNFISFQEMEPAMVRNYLRHVARLNPELRTAVRKSATVAAG